jgi:hypothetical protein
MKTIVPANPIKVYMRQGEIADGEYLCSNVAFIIVDGPPKYPGLTFVTISGTPIPAHDIAFARVLIDGAWVSHD